MNRFVTWLLRGYLDSISCELGDPVLVDRGRLVAVVRNVVFPWRGPD